MPSTISSHSVVLLRSRVPARIAISTVLLSAIIQLYRWWLQRCKHGGSSSPKALKTEGKVEGSFGRIGNVAGDQGRMQQRRPPPRPGKDDDERLEDLADDPRYFEGAELGKTQRAVLGQQFEAGINTVSFDPVSTLVRPSMRIRHAAPLAHADRPLFEGAPLKPDDVVVAPNCLCGQGERQLYDSLVSELRELEANGTTDLSESSTCQELLRQIKVYCSLTDKDGTQGMRLVWYRDASSDPNPFCATSGAYEDVLQNNSDQLCTVNVTFGAACEIVFRHSEFPEKLTFPSQNGSLYLFGRDVRARWEHSIDPLTQPDGLISITMISACSGGVEESTLAPMPKPASGIPLKGSVGDAGTSDSGVARPSMRIITVTDPREITQIKHDDVVIIPNFCCNEDDWDVYYGLLQEMRESQAQGERQAEWVSWHEGSHLLTKNPKNSRTFQNILDQICEHFAIVQEGGDIGTRFNWYRDGSDWKPFHHDSAAFNPSRAAAQNCTVGISLGASRELAFRHAKTGELIYFPQTNGMLFFFGRDVNIRWQHGLNALAQEEQDGKGRISIILWGLSTLAIDEPGSPPMLVDDHSKGGKGKGKGKSADQGQCRNFALHGSCSYGDRCKYSHDRRAGGGGSSGEVCRNFRRGACTYGDRCRHSHAGA